MSAISEALSTLFSVGGIAFATLGFVIGCVGGAIVGIGGALTTALVIPFTLDMSPANAMIILIGVYSGVSYAGSIPSILINTPGSPSSAVVAIEGHALARQGKAALAITISAVASALGALIGAVCLIGALPLLNTIAKAFGSQEFLMFAVFGLASIVAASDAGLTKGYSAGILGALVASIGSNLLDANPRFTLGIYALVDGVDLIAAMIGIFAFAELVRLSRSGDSIALDRLALSNWRADIATALGEWKAILRGSGLGIVTGIVPGEGGTVATFMSYLTERQLARARERFGRGHPAGIAGPEAANNAVIGGALIPTLSLGIPGNVATALLLSAMMLHGLRPGPTLFTSDLAIVYTICGSILIGGVLTMLLGLTAARPLAMLTLVPAPVLVPVVCVVSVIGVYASSFNFGHVWMALAAGVLGYGLTRYRYPIIAFLLGLIVGPIAEENFVRTWQLTEGRLWQVLERPICLVLFVLTVAMLMSPVWKRIAGRRGGPAAR